MRRCWCGSKACSSTGPGAIRNASLGEAKAGILIGYRNQEELRPVLDPEAGTALPRDILICGSE
ncbi:hypothetical protein [Marinovum algicola]|uniref:hypothetical protein n=1 Tax=Marinovum algicola TaxID=42444 RepID=UPI0024BB4C60|nr:hypothetical protein [Marinovum algicola]